MASSKLMWMDIPLDIDVGAVISVGHMLMDDMEDDSKPVYGSARYQGSDFLDRPLDVRCAGCDAHTWFMKAGIDLDVVVGHDQSCPWYAEFMEQFNEKGAR